MRMGGFGDQQKEVLAWIYLRSLTSLAFTDAPRAMQPLAAFCEWDPDELLGPDPTASERNSLSTSLRSLEERRLLTRYRANFTKNKGRQRTAYVALTNTGLLLARKALEELEENKKEALREKLRRAGDVFAQAAAQMKRAQKLTAQLSDIDSRDDLKALLESLNAAVSLLATRGY